MAVEAAKIKARLRALFPKANLSTKRLDEISAKLAKKPEDGATDAQIDEVLNDYNDNGAMTFEEIAKSDDKIRTLEAGKPKPKTEEVVIEEDEPTTEMGKLMKMVQGLTQTVTTLQQNNTQQTISQKFAADKRLKGIPEFMFKGYVPTKDEDYEAAVEGLIEVYKPFAEKNKLSAFGDDFPGSGDENEDAAAAKGKVVKEIDADTAAKIVGV